MFCLRPYNYRVIHSIQLLSGRCASTNSAIISSPFPNIEISNNSLANYIFDAQEMHANKTAVVCSESGETISHDQIRQRSLRLASALSRFGLGKGDVVAILAPNSPEFIVSLLGVTSTGAALTMYNPTYTTEEIGYHLNESSPSAIIAHSRLPKEILNCLKNFEKCRHLILIGSKDQTEDSDIHSFEKMLQDDGENVSRNVEIKPEDIALLPYSSGTTGFPKGVMLTHRNMVANVQQISHKDVAYRPAEGVQPTTIGVLPFFHMVGVSQMLRTLAVGGRIITMARFEKEVYVRNFKKYKVTDAVMVPPILSYMCKDANVLPDTLASVGSITFGAAPVPTTLLDNLRSKFGNRFIMREGYGLSETSPTVTLSPLDGYIHGSCGVPLSNTFIKIIDVDTKEPIASTAHEGEIFIKGPQVMKGYWNNAEATEKCLSKDGWLQTGDIGKVDENNNIFIVDRIKDLIKVKGFQVAPAELENILLKHPSVADVAVIGVKDEVFGEAPRAFVIPTKNSSPTAEDLHRYVNGKVAEYKKLSGGIVFLEEIPKSISGKILKNKLRKIE